MTRTAVDHEVQPSKPELGLIFVLLVGMSISVTAYLPPGFFNFWRQLVMWITGLMGGMLGQVVVSRADILTVNGFAMQVIDECTAVNYVIILSTAILLYTRHTIRYRFAGVLIAIPLIVLANALRLLVTGLAGMSSPEMFDFVHQYLWVAIFALLIFVIWKVWVDRKLRLTRETAQTIALMIGAGSATFALVIAIIPYGSFLGYFSSLFLKAFLWDSNAAIDWVSNRMQCVVNGASYEIPFTVEYFNVAVYAGLVLPLQKKGDWKTVASTIVGFVGAVLLNAVFIATIANGLITHHNGSLSAFLFIEKGFLLAVPFGLWWIVASGEDQGLKGQPDS